VNTGTVQEVHWPGYPKLFGKIVRLVLYSPLVGKWIAVVPRRSTTPTDCVEVEFTDMERIAALQKAGFNELDSLKRVLGL
jgi:hypothetical protein